MAALMTLTAATGAYALACSQCHETGQGGQEYAPNGHGHYYWAQRGCCHGRWRTDCVQEAPGCTYGHGACRGYYCDSRHACFNGCSVSGADAATFKPVGGGYAKDADAVYYNGRRMEGAHVQSFKYIGRGVARDKRHTYIDGVPAE